jgi:ubiquinone/menaquinone biosynthesis C-methylase UbiE
MSETLPPEPRTRWSEVSGGLAAATAYQQRFDDLAARGVDIHGEATFVEALLPPSPPPVRVLDAGCGTGRVATQLTAIGYHAIGVDSDADMIAVAQQRDPYTRWVRQDLSRLELRGQAFELAILAGNVVPLVAPGTLVAVMKRIAAHLRPGGLVVSGFGLDATHLPDGIPATTLAEYDAACTIAGLSVLRHYSTWDKDPYRDGDGYVVAVHRLND